jgi:hypothetical protein
MQNVGCRMSERLSDGPPELKFRLHILHATSGFLSASRICPHPPFCILSTILHPTSCILHPVCIPSTV